MALALWNLHAALGARAHSAGMQYFVNIVALVAGFVLLLAFQYGAVFTSGGAGDTAFRFPVAVDQNGVRL